MFKKYFTVNAANKSLPLVKKIVLDILDKGRKLKMIIEEAEVHEAPPEAKSLEAEIEGLIMELEDLGCFYKDMNFQIGLVDFPARMDGQEIFLCWRSNEERIQWYHSVESGYIERKPLPENYD